MIESTTGAFERLPFALTLRFSSDASGARRPGSEGELPYFGPLLKLPKDFIDINF